MKKVILIDGNSLINRAYYALPQLTDDNGTNTNAVYGFTNILLKIFRDENPGFMAVTFDMKKPTFRHNMFDGYKAQRHGMPPELAEQMPLIKEMLDYMGISKLELPGYEADDIIGVISRYCEENDLETTIITGDRDSFQLASDKTRILFTKKGVSEFDIITPEYMAERYGVTPEEFIDVKALMGDSSDNIPGVKGIGEKTACKLISEYKSLDNLYEHIDEQKGALKKKLIEGKELAYLSQKLSAILREIPAEISMDDIMLKTADADKLRDFYKRHSMFSVISRLEDILGSPEENLVEQPEEIVFSQSNPETDLPSCKEIYIKILRKDAQVNKKAALSIIILAGDKFYKISAKDLPAMKKILEDKRILKSGFDIKEDMLALLPYGIELAGTYYDLKIADYILDPENSAHDISDISMKYGLGKIESKEEFFGRGKAKKTITELTEAETSIYYAGILKLVKKSEESIFQKIKQSGMEKLFCDVEMPLIEVLASMEYIGFKVDQKALEETRAEFADIIAKLEEEIYDKAGEKFNINSPKQLGVILFEKLKLPVIKKTKTGFSTDQSVLEKLSEEHEIAALIISYRTFAKLQSTYVEGLLAIINPETGRIHSSFNQTVTSTGRISSTEPNLQNIPVREEIGRNLRKAFVAEENCLLVDADYSQIELRVLAHMADDKNLIDAFSHDSDIHTRTASEVFGVPVDEVTREQRSAAKAVNFGIIYGISDFGLSKNLGISRKRAGEYIEKYLAKYPKVSEYMENAVENGEKDGFVTTLMGRRRYIPQLRQKNYMVKNLGKRLAMNAPIQGSAADIIKLAMVKVYYKLKERGLKTRLILQVHDELILETPAEEEETMKEFLKHEMENAAKLKVKLVADVKAGKSWFDTK